MQDPPDLIPEMLAKWREGYEVVYAQRRQREGETWIKKLVARFGYWFINKFSDVDIPRDTGDFRLIDRRVVEQIKRFPEAHGFLRGMVALVGFRRWRCRSTARPGTRAGGTTTASSARSASA